MKKLLLSVTIIAALIAGATGCSSLDTRYNGDPSGLYPGVKAGKKAYDKADGIAEKSPRFIDLPLSFALDTALLPLDLLGVTSKRKKGKDDNATVPELPK